MQDRIISTEKVLARIGGDKPISRETLRQLRMKHAELLTPVMRGRYSAEKVEKLIDILTGVSSPPGHTVNYDELIAERIRNRKHGEHKRAIPH